MTTTIAESFCSVSADRAELIPIGTGGTLARLVAIETPTPWSDRRWKPDPEGSPLQQSRSVLVDYVQHVREFGDWDKYISTGVSSVLGIQPDAEWSIPGVQRVLVVTRPEAPFANFNVSEYHFPSGSPKVRELTATLLYTSESLDAFDDYEVEHAGHREFLVCTHGTVDICCAKFGVPLYNQARAAWPEVRAWRCTHFGGHRYAPTAWEFPAGYKWGFLDADTTRQVIERHGHPELLIRQLRGWSGAQGQSQLLDREGLKQFGWQWLEFLRRGEIVDVDLVARRWKVRLEFESPIGLTGCYEGEVGVAREIPEFGCGPKLREHEVGVPEYHLIELSLS